MSKQLNTEKVGAGMNLFEKLKGDKAKLPPKHSIRAILVAWVGGFLAISAVTLLSNTLSIGLVLGSFGASCVLIFGFPDVPFSQPRNVIGGHFLSSLIGMLCLTLFGATWWSVAEPQRRLGWPIRPSVDGVSGMEITVSGAMSGARPAACGDLETPTARPGCTASAGPRRARLWRGRARRTGRTMRSHFACRTLGSSG